jgi:ATP phosphoribosyltransferase
MLNQIISNKSVVPSDTVQIYQNAPTECLKLTIPTGRMQEKVLKLLNSIGLSFSQSGRSYRPVCSESNIEAKMLKAQNIPSMVALGRHDCGFTGYDWVVEQQADVVELLDLKFDPVRIVAATPEEMAEDAKTGFQSMKRPVIIASEYKRLTNTYIISKGLNGVFIQTFGATEALPPEDADMIIDNTATGSTLRQNRLQIVDEIMQSTTRFICNKDAYNDPVKRKRLEEMTMLMKSTLRAREKVLLEMNVAVEDLDRLVKDLPCMRAPTISQLYNGEGYAIKVAVPTADVPNLIPKLVAAGAKDILEYRLEKIVI